MTTHSAASPDTTEQMDEAMVDEFDVVAEWTADAVLQLGSDHALPAACRGSGSPSALEWLATRMELSADCRLLDVGAGVGGPAEYVARSFGVAPTLAEPMPGACRAALRLFGRPAVMATGSALPFADRSFDAAWSLGVLCTVADKSAHLHELARVVPPGSHVGLLVYERTADAGFEQPDGNHFPDHDELIRLLRAADLDVEGTCLMDELASPPTAWTDAVSRVEETMAAGHRHQPPWLRAQEQQDTLAALLGRGVVVARLVACRRGA